MTAAINREPVITEQPDGSRRVHLVPRVELDPELLEAVRTAADSSEDGRRHRLRSAARTAREGGHPVRAIAEAARLSRWGTYVLMKD